jgi:pimeloyl-ACP methyl ester carboxylesterase
MTQSFEYRFKSHYAMVDGVRIHYLDEGQGPLVWLMHGNTSWSYLYRKMIPPLVEAGYRCFVPDLMGFGLSDTPEEESVYSLQEDAGNEVAEHMIRFLNHLAMHAPGARAPAGQSG